MNIIKKLQQSGIIKSFLLVGIALCLLSIIDFYNGHNVISLTRTISDVFPSTAYGEMIVGVGFIIFSIAPIPFENNDIKSGVFKTVCLVLLAIVLCIIGVIFYL